MKTYTITFKGRKVGAIGTTYQITATVQAADEESARLALYTEYGHVMVLNMKEA